jgi:hypothetical protein
LAGVEGREREIVTVLKLPIQVKNICRFFARATVPAIGEDDTADIPEERGDVGQEQPSISILTGAAKALDERKSDWVRKLWRDKTRLIERAVQYDFQLWQARIGSSCQIQSYYGSLPAAKRFEVTDSATSWRGKNACN